MRASRVFRAPVHLLSPAPRLSPALLSPKLSSSDLPGTLPSWSSPLSLAHRTHPLLPAPSLGSRLAENQSFCCQGSSAGVGGTRESGAAGRSLDCKAGTWRPAPAGPGLGRGGAGAGLERLLKAPLLGCPGDRKGQAGVSRKAALRRTSRESGGSQVRGQWHQREFCRKFQQPFKSEPAVVRVRMQGGLGGSLSTEPENGSQGRESAPSRRSPRPGRCRPRRSLREQRGNR